MEIPLLPEVKRLLRLQSMYPHEPILIRALGAAETRQAFAAAFLARWLHDGQPPPGEPANAFQRDAVAQARYVHDLMVAEARQTESGGGARLTVFNAVQWQLTTKVASNGSFCEVVPSEAWKKQRAQLARDSGKSHVGSRLVRRREKCGIFDSRLPIHWR